VSLTKACVFPYQPTDANCKYIGRLLCVAILVKHLRNLLAAEYVARPYSGMILYTEENNTRRLFTKFLDKN